MKLKNSKKKQNQDPNNNNNFKLGSYLRGIFYFLNNTRTF